MELAVLHLRGQGFSSQFWKQPCLSPASLLQVSSP